MTFFIWSQFAIVCLLGAMSPGPSLALIIYNSINYNRLSGVIAAIAHGLGIFVYAIATVLLLEFILKNSEKIFFIIQIFGAIFLIIFGLTFIFNKKNNEEIKSKHINSNSFIQGFSIAIINPKIFVWFIAIYSQFINLSYNILDKILLILTPTIVDAIWYSLIAILVTGFGIKDVLIKNKIIIEKSIGILLIIIALSLIYSLINS